MYPQYQNPYYPPQPPHPLAFQVEPPADTPRHRRPGGNSRAWYVIIITLLLVLVGDSAYTRYEQWRFRQNLRDAREGLEKMEQDQKEAFKKVDQIFKQAGETITGKNRRGTAK